MVVSPLNYTYTLLTFGVLFTDDEVKYKNKLFLSKNENQNDAEENKKEQEVISHKIKSVRKYCEFFTDMALQSFDCQQYKYSIQALSAVIAARRTCGIKPIWSKHFKIITGYDFAEIEE